MPRLFLKAILCFLLCVSAASATTTVTANLKSALGTSFQSDAFVRFRLRGYSGSVPRVSGGVIVVTIPDVAPDATGLVSTALYNNYEITPAGTYWTVEYWAGGNMVSTANYTICTITSGACSAGVATYDLNQATANTVPPVVLAPTGDTTYARLDGGNTPFTGNVNFTAATSALLRGCVSVKDAGFNAAGDGTTDDTVAIQAALTSLSNSTCLVFPYGTYLVSNYLTLSSKSNITIIMLGNVKPSVTLANTNSGIFFFSAITNLDFIPRIINQTYPGTTNAIRLDNVQRANIHDGVIDLKMNSFDGTAAIQLGASTTDVNIQGNYICSGYGVLSNNVTGILRIAIHGNIFEGQKRYGSTGTGDAIEFNHPTNVASAIEISNNTFFGYQASLANSRIILIGLANVNGFKVTGNVVYDSQMEAVHIESGSKNGVISGNQIGQAIHGVNIYSNGVSVSDISITGNQVYPGAMAAIFSASSADYGCGIMVNVGTGGFVSKNISITGNQIKGTTSSSKGICAYDLDGGTISDNTVSDMTLAGIDLRRQNGVGVGPQNVVVTGNTVRSSTLNYLIGGVTGGVGTLTGGAGPMIGITFDNNWSYSGATLNFDSEISTRTNSRIRIPYANLTLLKLTAGDVLYNPVPAINLPFEYLVTTSGATGVYVATAATKLTQTVSAATCTTAATINATCTGTAITWPVPFTDNTYKMSCGLTSFTNQPYILGATKTTGVSFTLSIAANSAAAASGTVECTGGY